MTYILFGLGFLFILLGFVDVFPKVKQNYIDSEEMQRWQIQKREVLQAKEDLKFLLEELKNVSDQTVNSIETKIFEAKKLSISKVASEKVNHQNVQVPLVETNNIAGNLNNSIKMKDTSVITKKSNNVKSDLPISKKSSAEVRHETDKKQKINSENLDKHTYIYQLSKQGISVDEIAQKVQMGKGEIELIIGIKRRGEQA